MNPVFSQNGFKYHQMDPDMIEKARVLNGSNEDKIMTLHVLPCFLSQSALI